MRGGPLLDEGAVLNWADELVRAIRKRYNDRADELIEEHDLFEAPSRLATRRAWVLQLEGRRIQAWAELEERRRVWERVSLAWAEGRWADVARLAARHCPDLPADAKALADRLRDVARAFPEDGRTAQTLRAPLPAAEDVVTVPWGVDPGAPVLGRSPRADHRQVWQILFEEFPAAGSARSTLATHRLLREVLDDEMPGRDAQEWRREISAALAAGTRGALADEDRSWAAESLLQRVVAPLAADRDRLAGAVADAAALHQEAEGQCGTCRTAWPCVTARALGHEHAGGVS